MRKISMKTLKEHSDYHLTSSTSEELLNFLNIIVSDYIHSDFEGLAIHHILSILILALVFISIFLRYS